MVPAVQGGDAGHQLGVEVSRRCEVRRSRRQRRPGTAAAEFATSTGIRYTIGFDDGAVSQGYNVRGLPATFIISSDGIVLEQVFGAVSLADIDDKLEQWFS